MRSWITRMPDRKGVGEKGSVSSGNSTPGTSRPERGLVVVHFVRPPRRLSLASGGSDGPPMDDRRCCGNADQTALGLKELRDVVCNRLRRIGAVEVGGDVERTGWRGPQRADASRHAGLDVPRPQERHKPPHEVERGPRCLLPANVPVRSLRVLEERPEVVDSTSSYPSELMLSSLGAAGRSYAVTCASQLLKLLPRKVTDSASRSPKGTCTRGGSSPPRR